MNIFEELNGVLGGLGMPVETGVFSGTAPDAYLVIVPLSDGFGYHADNTPHEDVQEAPGVRVFEGQLYRYQKQDSQGTGRCGVHHYRPKVHRL